MSALAQRSPRTAEPIDHAALAELAAMPSDRAPNLLVELVDLFRQQAPGRLERIEAACRASDRISLEREAHSLRGSAASLGLRALEATCARLEAVAGARSAAAGTFAMATASLVEDARRRLENGLEVLVALRSQHRP